MFRQHCLNIASGEANRSLRNLSCCRGDDLRFSSNPSQVNGLGSGLAIDAGGFIAAIRDRRFWF
jgi:hypothetical protein